MHWHILKTLLHKEALRHLANRGGIVLAALLVVAAMLLSFFKSTGAEGGGALGGVKRCYVTYWQDGPWIEHLRRHVPENLRDRVLMRSIGQMPTDPNGFIQYETNTGGIQIRPSGPGTGRSEYLIWFWYPGGDSSVLAPFETWFWRESATFFQQQAVAAVEKISPEAKAAMHFPQFEVQRSSLLGTGDTQSRLATALVLFAVFFACVYLLPSLTCEERERGVLLAQALSPASPLEILTAKFFFYPLLGMGLAAILGGIDSPAVWGRPLFWAALLVTALGSLGIGLTIASLARTQRSASMGAMCYLLVVVLFIQICEQNGIRSLPYLALEYHCPRVLHAAMSNEVAFDHLINLGFAAVLALGWCTAAVVTFRRYGWQ